MSGAQNPPRVTQVDRDAAIKAAGFNDEGDLQYWGSNANRAEVAVLTQAFARHREAAEAEAKAREAVLRDAALGLNSILQEIILSGDLSPQTTLQVDERVTAVLAALTKEPDA